jgi:type IV pilus assembly protein PilB
MAIRTLDQILVDLGFLTDDQRDLLIQEQRRRPDEAFGKLAMEMGYVDDEQVAQGLAEQFGLKMVYLAELQIPAQVLDTVTEAMAQLYKVIPVSLDGSALTIAMSDPQKLSVQDELRTFLGLEIRTMVATERDVQKALDRFYSAGSESVESIVADMETDKALADAASAVSGDGPIDLTSVEALADSAPVRKLLNMVMLMAIKDKASDLHFEPFEDEFRIRIKADGILYEMVPPPRHLAFAITTRIKVMANLDIAERRLPQDGRIELNVGGHPVDLRISVLPTMFGESVVMRVLDRSVISLDLQKTGMGEEILRQFREVINKPNGIILVTGPTGSGKTTTLYAALSELNKISDKIITTEDPVEYDIDGLIQVPIDASIGNTFSHCLRSILRQDPDKILVGEIRDVETAEIAVQASLTGHTVFSTLHTNDAPSSITRLRDMGIPAFLITATLEGVLAQRLVRRICSKCAEEVMPTAEMLADLELNSNDTLGKKFYRGRGCENCNRTGYRGRVGLFEMMPIDDDTRDLIMGNASTDVLRANAKNRGMVTLRDCGLQAVFAGMTTAEEVIRETILES